MARRFNASTLSPPAARWSSPMALPARSSPCPHSHRHRAAGFDRAADSRLSTAPLLTPSAATLTIRRQQRQYVIPAGSQMVTNYTSLSTTPMTSSAPMIRCRCCSPSAMRAWLTLPILSPPCCRPRVTAPNPSIADLRLSHALRSLGFHAVHLQPPTAVTTSRLPPPSICRTASKSIGYGDLRLPLGTTTTVFLEQCRHCHQ